jgi:predicted O-linked N-acetylglucosamine transferase (SPINDLY family)
MTDASLGLEKAMAEYNAGQFSAALSTMEGLWPSAGEPQRRSLILLKAGACLKLGDKRQAAEAFVEAARLLPEKKATFLPFAVNLYAELELHARIAEIADEAAACRPQDSDFLFKLANSCKLAGKLISAKSFIAGLDLSKTEHFRLFYAFENALGDSDGFYRFLCEACATQPDNVLLNNLRYQKARANFDFQALEEYDARLADPGNPSGQAFLRNELVLYRLMRTDDEESHLLPSYDSVVRQKTAPEHPVSRRAISPAGTRLRIGYLSNDFCSHATMRLFEEVLLQHDRDRFDIKLFCYTPERGTSYQRGWPQNLQASVITVRGLTDADAARCIAEHGIDILVDLKGHTSGARLGIVDRADAPIKVTYLGYPGSVVGVDIDYALTDPVVTPDSSTPFYVEKLCRLPETYQANGSRLRPRPLTLSRRDLGLPEDKLILGSFNAANKITRETLFLWAEIMQRLPDAVLLMLCKQGLARENVIAAFRQVGVSPERIIFFAKEAYERYLTRIALVDLALDTHPYNGHTTSSDILWAGTPLVTFRGGCFASRVSASLLHAIDVPELIADNEVAYGKLVVDLVHDRDRRERLRQRLERNRTITPLFDTDRFTRHLERGYELMAERARAGLAPDHIDVQPLPPRQAPFLDVANLSKSVA